jgi:TetR/AcrR family transcriptional repressor of mexJK operon
MAKATAKPAEPVTTDDRQPPTGKRQAIIDAAARVFLQAGYGAASMDAIAAEAGASKQTVYSHFGAKDALFAAIVEGKCEDLMAPVAMPAVPARDHEKALAELARRFVASMLAPGNMALFRLVIAESARFPELARAFYRAGPLTAVENLAGYLTELADAGTLTTGDPIASARLFFSMLRGDIYIRALLGLDETATAAEMEALVRQAVAAFLAAHAPK